MSLFNCTAIALLLCFSAGLLAAERPNILIILSDDHAAADMGAYGNAEVRTPHLDALAAQGMRFELAFTTAAICTPSRSSLYTGLYPLRHGAHRNHTQVYPGIRSLPHYFQPLGYQVALAGKTHMGPASAFPFAMLPATGNRHSTSSSKISAYFNSMEALFSGSRPFLLVAATSLPHSTSATGGGYPAAQQYDPDALTLPAYLVDTPATRRARAGYYELVTRLDSDIGTMLQLLAASKAAHNTVVIYSSDHGAGFAFEKWTNYDAGIRVPLLLSWPGQVQPGAVTNALVSVVDILPTLLDLVGDSRHPGIADLDGRSFLPVLLQTTDTHHDLVYATNTTLGIRNAGDAFPQRSVRSARFKYIHNLNPAGLLTNNVTEQGQGGWRSWVELARTDSWAAQRVAAYQRRPAEEFYDLQADPAELHNLIDQPGYSAEINELRKALENWRRQQGDQGLQHPATGSNIPGMMWQSIKLQWHSFWAE